MAMQMNNTKWTLAILAAFAVGVSVSAMMKGAQNSAADMAGMEPAAGEANAPASNNPVDQTVIAVVNGNKLTMKDYNMYLSTLPQQVQAAPQDQVFSMVQDQVVVGTLISEKAQGLENDPEVQKRMNVLRDNVMRATWLEREVKSRITESAMKNEYDSFAKDFKPSEEINAQHILVDSEDKAKEVLAKMKEGAKFEDLVKEYSKDKGAKNNGDLGYFREGDMVKEFATAAFKMQKGQTSTAPVKTQFGYHVIRVNDRRMGQMPTFEQLKPQIEAKLQRDMVETVVDGLRQSAKIELFDAQGQPAKLAKETATDKASAEPAAGDQAADKTDKPAAAQ